jgi:hypothetical protein
MTRQREALPSEVACPSEQLRVWNCLMACLHGSAEGIEGLPYSLGVPAIQSPRNSPATPLATRRAAIFLPVDIHESSVGRSLIPDSKTAEQNCKKRCENTMDQSGSKY